MEIKFYPLTIDVVNLGTSSYIRLFGRTVDDEKICVYDNSLKPYFYVRPKNPKALKKLVAKISKFNTFDSRDRPVDIISVSVLKKKILGAEVELIKVEVNLTSDIQVLREEFKSWNEVLELKEYDISFYKRYLIDKQITMLCLSEVYGDLMDGSENVDLIIKGEVRKFNDELIPIPKILCFDIETFCRDSKYSDSSNDPVLSIAFSSNYGLNKVITWKKCNLKYVQVFEDEANMLNEFKQIIKIENPDYLVGYFSDGFDLPYIKKRCDEHKIKLNLGLDGSSIKLGKDTNSAINIKGVCHIDVLKFIRIIMRDSLETESYDLDSVAKELIGEGKIEVDFVKIMGDIDNNIDLLCKYNLNDVVLTLKLFEKVLPNINEIVKLTGMQITEVCRTTFGQLAEQYLMKNIQRFNEVILNKPNYDSMSYRRMQTYEGGLVFEPKPGIYKDICVVDFRSLYPSIIDAYNICPSTLTNNPKDNYASPDLEGEKYYFTKEYKGFVPVLIRELIERRIEVKKLITNNNKDPFLDARSYSLKILSNSFYGYLGFPGARWYSIECAKSITGFAREYISKVINLANKEFSVIYSDTDGCFVTLNNKNKNDAFKFIEKFNKTLPSLMCLELENFYPKGIFVSRKGDARGAKKKYALLDEKGEIIIKGFETIRTDWSYLARDVQRKVIEMALKSDDHKKVLKYLQEVIDDITKDKIHVGRMVIRTQLRKNLDEYMQMGPHVVVAKRMKDIGIKVGIGSVIEYVISSGKGKIRDKARHISEAKDYDLEYYLNNQILPAVSKILEVLGYGEKDILGKSVQSKLSEF